MGIVFYDLDKHDEIMNRICECGHKLMMHTYLLHIYNYVTETTALYTSQCTSCGWEEDEPVCKYFGYKKDANNK